MRGKTQWNERPHLHPFEDPDAVYICRLAPSENKLTVEWTDAKQEGGYRFQWRPMFTGEPWSEQETDRTEITLCGLTPWRDYEVRVARKNGECTGSRYVRMAPVPGTVINYLHPQDDRYAFSGKTICSPNLIRLPSGKLLASMDTYEHRGQQNLSFLYESDDRGETWHYVCDLFPLMWGKMFLHRGRLYMIGCSTEFGDVIIGASDDEGHTWTAPVHLFCGGNTAGDGFSQSPMPVIIHRNRLYVSMEYSGRNVGFRPTVLSIREDADLLDPANWHCTKPILIDSNQFHLPGVRIEDLLEGNLYVNPDGELCCMLRVDGWGFDMADGKAAVMKIHTEDPDAPMEFSHFASMPAGYHSKFMLQYDDVSGYYIAIGNLPTQTICDKQRNVLGLMYSKDSDHWKVACRIIDSAIEQRWEVGYQYPSFLFDGDDILLQVRTATNGARNFHDANYETFHIIRDFRSLLKQEGEPAQG